MDSFSLGPKGPRVRPLGIGTWAWGDRTVWGYGSTYDISDLEAAFQAVLDAGVTFFDTAEIYGFGHSERMLGQFARDSNREIITATKFMPFPWRLWKGTLRNALRASLNRLGTTRVDLYQIHWPLPPVPVKTWMAALADAVEAGLVSAAGVSNHNVQQMRRAHATLEERGIPLASNQVEYSLLNRSPEHNGLLDTCHELGVILIAYSPLAMGLLTGKYTPENPPPGMRGRRFGLERLAQVQPLIGLLREIGEGRGGKTPSQVALNWTICKGTVPIPGAKNARQARDNAAAAGWCLTPEEVAALDAASDPLS